LTIKLREAGGRVSDPLAADANRKGEEKKEKEGLRKKDSYEQLKRREGDEGR
jgi:hypothetical protein